MRIKFEPRIEKKKWKGLEFRYGTAHGSVVIIGRRDKERTEGLSERAAH